MNRVKNIFFLAAIIMMALSCTKNGMSGTEELSSGYLTVNTALDSEIQRKSSTPSSITSVDVNPFNINIKSRDEGGEPINLTYKYSDILGKAIELSARWYVVTAESPNTLPVAWNQPIYRGTEEVLIETDKPSTTTVHCSIVNSIVSINCTDSFIDEMTDYTITVTADGVEDGKINYLKWIKSENSVGLLDENGVVTKESKPGYFPAGTKINVEVEAHRAYDPTTPVIKLVTSIENSEAAKHYVIKLDAYATGDSEFIVNASSSVTTQNVDATFGGYDTTGDIVDTPSVPTN